MVIISNANLIQEKNITLEQFFETDSFVKYHYVNNLNETVTQDVCNLNEIRDIFKNNEKIANDKLKIIYQNKSKDILKNINKFNKKLKKDIIYSNDNFNICSYISTLNINFFDLLGGNIYEELQKNNSVNVFESFIKKHIQLILKKRYLNFDNCLVDYSISFNSIVSVKIRFIDFSFESLKSGYEIYCGVNKLCKKDPNVFSNDCSKYIEVELSKVKF